MFLCRSRVYRGMLPTVTWFVSLPRFISIHFLTSIMSSKVDNCWAEFGPEIDCSNEGQLTFNGNLILIDGDPAGFNSAQQQSGKGGKGGSGKGSGKGGSGKGSRKSRRLNKSRRILRELQVSCILLLLLFLNYMWKSFHSHSMLLQCAGSPPFDLWPRR